MSDLGFDIEVHFMDGDHIRVFEQGGRIAWQVRACGPVVRLIHELVQKQGRDPRQWKGLPIGSQHEAILLRKLMLLATGKWQSPQRHEEICHCRQVSYQKIEEAIMAGAHTPQLVSLWTSASTACGSCRPDVQQMIEYIVKESTLLAPSA